VIEFAGCLFCGVWCCVVCVLCASFLFLWIVGVVCDDVGCVLRVFLVFDV